MSKPGISTIVGYRGRYDNQLGKDDGGYSWEDVQTATRLETLYTLQDISNSLMQIRHFFHAIGQERCRLIIQEAGMKAARQRRRRLAAKRKARTP